MKNIDDDLDDGNAEFEDKSFVVSSTSWGESGIEDDYRALKKYKELNLKKEDLFLVKMSIYKDI